MHNRRKVTVSDQGLSANLDGNRPAGLCGGTEGHGRPRSRALLEFGRCGPAGVGWEPERSQVHLVAPQGAERLLAVGAGPAALWTFLLPTPCFRRFVASNPGVFPAAVLQKGSRQALDALPEAEDQYGRAPGHAPELDPWGGSGAARVRQSPWTRLQGPFRGPPEPLEILHLMVLTAFFMRPPHTFPRGRVPAFLPEPQPTRS